MSVIKLKAKSNATLGDDKHDSGRLFQKSGSFSDNEKLNFAKSCNIIRQPINFSSPRGKQMKMDLLSSSQEEGEDQGSGLQDKLDTIKQEDEGMSSDEPEDDEEEKEDSTSGEEDDSSIDADMQGDDFETEDQIYQRILANQEEAKTEEVQNNQKEENISSLVDKNMVNLLKACSMLKRPPQEDIDKKSVNFGPKTRQKLLILDMDETMIHSKFYKVNQNEMNDPDVFSPGLRPD